MHQVTTQQAAELVGKNRSTIWRAIKNGRVSATRCDTGDYVIDVAELERAFGPFASPQQGNRLRDGAKQPRASGNETNALRIEVELLRERIASLETDKQDLRAERDRLLGVIEQQTEQVRFLTDERVNAGAAGGDDEEEPMLTEKDETKRVGWWRRLVGRS